MRRRWFAGFMLALVPTTALASQPAVKEVDVSSPAAKSGKAAAHANLKIGVVGVQESAQADGDKLAKYLSKQLAKPIDVAVYKDYDAAANALVDESIDIAWMPPLQGWNAKLGGARLLVKLIRGGEPYYRSVFFVRGDSPFKSLKDVKNARVAWVDQNSATGHVFALATIAREGLTKAQLFSDEKFLGNHDAVCEAVENKTADIGASLSDEPPEGKTPVVDGCKAALGKKADSLRILAVSDRVPSDVVAVRHGMDDATAEKVKKAMLGLPGTDEGRKLLTAVFKAESTGEITKNEFEPVEKALEAASSVDLPH